MCTTVQMQEEYIEHHEMGHIEFEYYMIYRKVGLPFPRVAWRPEDAANAKLSAGQHLLICTPFRRENEYPYTSTVLVYCTVLVRVHTDEHEKPEYF